MAILKTTAKSYYQLVAEQPSDVASLSLSLPFNFDAVNVKDIAVMAVNTSAVTHTVLENGVDYSVNLTTQTVQCLQDAWQDCDGFSGLTGADGVRVFRTTSNDTLVDFTSSAFLNENELDLAYKQNLYTAQENNEDAALKSSSIQSVGTSELENDAVTSVKLNGASVTADKLVDDSVRTAKILDDTVTIDKITDLSVDQARLTDDAVHGVNIQDGAVTADKLASGAVRYENVIPATPEALRDLLPTGTVTPENIKYSPTQPYAWGRANFTSISVNTPAADILTKGNITGPSFNVDIAKTNEFDNRYTLPNNNYEPTRIFFQFPSRNTDYIVLLSWDNENPNSPNGYHTLTIQTLNRTTGYFDIQAGGEVSRGEFYFVNFLVFGGTYTELFDGSYVSS